MEIVVGILLQRLRQQVEVLMINGLRKGMEGGPDEGREDGFGVELEGGIGECRIVVGEQGTDAGRKFAVATYGGGKFVAEKGKIARNEPCGGRKIAENAIIGRIGATGMEIGNDFDAIYFTLRELCFDVKYANGIYFVAKEIYSVGVFVGEREDIDDTATNRELSGLIDEIDLGPTAVDEGLLKTGDRDFLPCAERKSLPAESVLRHDGFQEGFGVTDHNTGGGVGSEAVECGSALYFVGSVGTVLALADTIGRGEETDVFFALRSGRKEQFEVGKQVGGIVGIVHEDELMARRTTEKQGQNEGLRRTAQAFEKGMGGALLHQFCCQRQDGGMVGVEVLQVE